MTPSIDESSVAIHATHYNAELHFNGIIFAKISGAVGKPTTKNPMHQTRDKLFNYYLAKAWLKRIESEQCSIGAALNALKKYQTKIERKV